MESYEVKTNHKTKIQEIKLDSHGKSIIKSSDSKSRSPTERKVRFTK